MFNLFRMDLFHVLRSKAFYICFCILSATTIFTFGLLYAMSNSQSLVQYGITVSGNLDAIKDSFSHISILELYHQTNISGGMFPIVTGIFASLFVCIDFESGFIKNILSIHENKWKYIVSKLLCLGMINFFYLVGTFIISLILNLLCGQFFSAVPFLNILFYGFSAWMLTNAFSALILMICILTRSKAAGIASAIFFCSGMIVLLFYNILNLFGVGKIMEYTLYMNLASCPFSYHGLKSLQAVAVSVVFLILYTIISKIVLTKKDI